MRRDRGERAAGGDHGAKAAHEQFGEDLEKALKSGGGGGEFDGVVVPEEGGELDGDGDAEDALADAKAPREEADHADDDGEGVGAGEPEGGGEIDGGDAAGAGPEGEPAEEPAGDESDDGGEEGERGGAAFGGDGVLLHAFEDAVDDAVDDGGMADGEHDEQGGDDEGPSEVLLALGDGVLGAEFGEDAEDGEHSAETAADEVEGIFEEGGEGADAGGHAEAGGAFDAHQDKGDLTGDVFAHLAEGVGAQEG